MCNGESGRSSQGGTIAVLRPTAPSLPPGVEDLHANALHHREISLRFAQTSSETTTAVFNGLGPSHSDDRVIIHRDGDLVTGPMDDASVLYSIAVPKGVASDEAFPLACRLDLTVGGRGVIGRRISLLRDRVVVGQGIIGWN